LKAKGSTDMASAIYFLIYMIELSFVITKQSFCGGSVDL
jgi:hypothetical protein